MGRNGFIGSALYARLNNGRNKIYSYPRPDLDYLYYFSSPSSNILFDQSLDWCLEETVNGFLNVIQFCRDNKIKLIYPSSATVYNKNTTYAKCKSILEEIHSIYGGNVLGLRLFAGYGKEEKKGEYASIVYQFCKAMKAGKRPVIFGDGKQTRDFMYVEDMVGAILRARDKTGIVDIGTGINHSFNDVVHIINQELGTDISPIYVRKPRAYVQETPCEKGCGFKYMLRDGVREILNSL